MDLLRRNKRLRREIHWSPEQPWNPQKLSDLEKDLDQQLRDLDQQLQHLPEALKLPSPTWIRSISASGRCAGIA